MSLFIYSLHAAGFFLIKLMFLFVDRTTLKQAQILLRQTRLAGHQLLKQIMEWNT